jgi:hypothetical protein
MNTNDLGHGRGRISVADISLPPEKWLFNRPFSRNIFLYDSATIVAQLLRRDPEGKQWNLGTMYIEFENNGGALVSVPTAARDEGKSYFDSLSLSSTRDYLRVPVIATKLESTDADLYPAATS